MDMYSGKEYEKFVIDYLVSDIMERYGIKTKKEARKYLFNALAMDIVGCEISQTIEYLRSKNER